MEISEVHVVLLSYEFCEVFSGNGVFARTVASALLSCHQNLKLSVICAVPATGIHEHSYQYHREVNLVCIPVEKWLRLDIHSDHDRFALAAAEHDLVKRLLSSASAIIGVDWTGHTAYRRLRSFAPSSCRFIYFMFRVFSRNQTDSSFYEEKEEAALRDSQHVLVLSSVDMSLLRSRWGKLLRRISVASPPLREDIRELAMNVSPKLPLKCLLDAMLPSKKHRFLLCVCRISPEKYAHRFAEMAKILEDMDLLSAYDLIPCIVGVRAVESYFLEMVDPVVSNIPSFVLLEKYVSAEEMAFLYSNSMLLIHPPDTDAFGMCVLEAAAFGCPSVLRSGNCVGATDCLPEGSSLCYGVQWDDDDTMAPDKIAACVSNILNDISEYNERRIRLRTFVESTDYFSMKSLEQTLLGSLLR